MKKNIEDTFVSIEDFRNGDFLTLEEAREQLATEELREEHADRYWDLLRSLEAMEPDPDKTPEQVVTELELLIRAHDALQRDPDEMLSLEEMRAEFQHD